MNRKNIVLFVFLFIIVIRFINITMPILEGTAMRQTQTAFIARNFFKDGINILYPKVDHFGNDPGYLVLEFPIMNVLAAYGYVLLGGVHEWIGRILSILFFLGACCFLFSITKKLFGEDCAIWAIIAFGLSPLSIIFSRAFMPDFEMIFFSLGALYLFFNSRLWLSAIFLSIALLVKPHSFYIIMPLFYILWKRQGKNFILDYKNWIYLFIAITPAILWYIHASTVHSHFTQEETYNYELSNWFDPKRLLDLKLYINIAKIYSRIFLTPAGLILFISGLFIKTKGKQNIIWAWLFGCLLYMLAFITHMWEPYYHLNLLPVASIFIARAIVQIQKLSWKKIAYTILIILFVPFFLRYSAYAYIVPKGYKYIPEAGKRVQQLTDKGDLVVASAAGGPQGLYFCDRKGWGFLLPVVSDADTEQAIKRLEDLHREGATVFVATVMNDFNKSVLFKEYLFKNYKLMEHKQGKYIIFSLKSNTL